MHLHSHFSRTSESERQRQGSPAKGKKSRGITIINNYSVQWRFVNAVMVVVNDRHQ